MAETKQELLAEAVSIVSSYPQVPSLGRSSGGVVGIDAAKTYYNILVPPAMESFIYGFGMIQLGLSNPEDDPDDSNFKIFNLPKDVGFIFTLARTDSFPSIGLFIGKRGVRTISSFNFNRMPKNKLRIYYPDDYQNELSIGYITKDPDVLDMSSNFQAAVRFHVASQLAEKFVQQRNVGVSWLKRAQYFYDMAKIYTLNNINSFTYIVQPLPYAVNNADTLGETPSIGRPSILPYRGR